MILGTIFLPLPFIVFSSWGSSTFFVFPPLVRFPCSGPTCSFSVTVKPVLSSSSSPCPTTETMTLSGSLVTFAFFPLTGLFSAALLLGYPFVNTGIRDLYPLVAGSSWQSELEPNSGDIDLCFVPSNTKLSLMTKLSAWADSGDLWTAVLVFAARDIFPMVRKVSSSVPVISMMSSSSLSSATMLCFFFTAGVFFNDLGFFL